MADSGNETEGGQGDMQGGNNNPPLESTLRCMAEFFGRPEIQERWNERTTSEVPNDVALERFQKFRPPIFTGERGVDEAEKWMEGMENIYQALDYSDGRKVAFGEFQLRGPAREWWRVVKERWEAESTPCLWSTFVAEFWKKFIPQVVRERKEEAFIGLKQKVLTVAQYEVQFTKLSKYAPDMVNTEEKRKRRFVQGLDIGIQTVLVSARMDTYADVVEFAQKAEDCLGRLKEVRKSQSKKVTRLENPSESSSQEPVRQTQKVMKKSSKKRLCATSASMPVKRKTIVTPCQFCGKNNHRKNHCWLKAGKCLRCGSSEHKIRDCPKD